MDKVTGLGKYLFAIPFLIFGLMHFMAGADMAGMVPFPPELLWVYLTGLAHILAAVAIFIGRYDKLATFLLGIMLLIFVFTIHLPGAMEGNQASVSNLLKDVALAGGAWMYAAGLARDRTGPAR